MFIEFINSLFLDLSLAYLYLALILISFGVMYLSQIYSQHVMEGQYVFKEQHVSHKINLNQLKNPLTINESFVTWLVIIFEKMDEQDEDEDSSASYFNEQFKIRGGQLWRGISYSPLLKNIVVLS